MDKVWYILIDEVEEGPFSPKELWFDSRVNLETLVWKEGFRDWTPLKNVKELRKYFQPDPSSDKDDKKDSKGITNQSEIALDYSNDPNFFFFFIVVGLLLLCFFLYRMHYG